MAPTCFVPLGPSSGSIRRNLAKVTVFVKVISKNTSLKLCCAVAICAVCTGCCAACDCSHTVKIVVVLWQYVLCVLGAVRRVTAVTRRTAPSAHTTD
jgi:hypothetical protein